VSDNPYRDLPAVDRLIEQVESRLPRALFIAAARQGLDLARLEIAAGHDPDVHGVVEGMVRRFERSAGVRVVNASGVLLHTNLGRAPWSSKAIEAAIAAAGGYGNVELDLDTGERGQRGAHVSLLLRELTGAGDALVVNNNAAAVLLALAATSAGMSVPVSRGELIEIGGAYRLPAVMAVSGARMVEVGTTNRTRIGDYQVALQTHHCGAILKVHPSNFRVTGFTEETSADALAALAAANGIPLIYDIGSGLLDSSAPWLPAWLRGEPGARQAISSGAGLVTFSGDKLIGGPQAGLIVGDQGSIATLRSHPLARALRADGVTLAALAATLEEHLEGPPTGIPFWSLAMADPSTLTRRCEVISKAVDGTVEPSTSAVGAGSAPGMEIPSPVIRIEGGHGMFACLLAAETPILARRDAGDLIIDLRAVDPADDELIIGALLKCR
jgi:L-seryl-tRNA(Ser) seleniumtransferase